MNLISIKKESNNYRIKFYDEYDNIKNKTFSFKRYSEDEALIMIDYYKNSIQTNNNPIIVEKDKVIMIVFYNHSFYKVEIDFEDIEMIKEHQWYAQIDNSIKSKNVIYIRSFSTKKSLQSFVMKFDGIVDHIDGNTLNNRKINLKKSDSSLNQRNLHFKSNNKSGIIGVRFNKQINCWQAQWVDLNGKQKIKSFNISKYGEEKAKELAIEYRYKMEEENNYSTRLNFK